MTESGTGSGLKRRMERRVRKKSCRSIVFVKVGWFDSEDNPSLCFAIGPGFVVIFEGKFVDMLISTFCGVTNNFATNAEIAIHIIWVLYRHCRLWASLHIAVFHTSFVGIDKDMFAICVEPDRSDLR